MKYNNLSSYLPPAHTLRTHLSTSPNSLPGARGLSLSLLIRTYRCTNYRTHSCCTRSSAVTFQCPDSLLIRLADIFIHRLAMRPCEALTKRTPNAQEVSPNVTIQFRFIKCVPSAAMGVPLSLWIKNYWSLLSEQIWRRASWTQTRFALPTCSKLDAPS